MYFSLEQIVMKSSNFRTWDFGGQREYYATHQYFLSKRSLYLVVWKISDGQRGISEILQWLVNIQVSIQKADFKPSEVY